MSNKSHLFPEYRELINELKASDSDFLEIFKQHDELDQQIRNMEHGTERGAHIEIENMKKEKLLLKDALYASLRKASAN
ncbi:MAG: hypothetical protein CVU16_13435 [Betaproteobacteria bacterium HGW-Betaproteobacteria-10]|nr:MAG: hypothetical protein CVU16_13435 [Betaproteobacteria bacterium HGW-Betaproteobacteria-10]